MQSVCCVYAHVLNIPDMYAFRDPKLVTMAKRKLKEIFPNPALGSDH